MLGSKDTARWWMMLGALPSSRESHGYARLAHVWKDRTRFHGPKTSTERRHEFFDRRHETHLTCTSFENFSLFEPSQWLPQLAHNLAEFPRKITACQWSYEWQEVLRGPGKAHRKRLFDVVIEVETPTGRGVLVVEAKNLGTQPGQKEMDPGYYLDTPEMAAFGENRWLLLCLDQAVARDMESRALPSRFGIVTWQFLAGLQVRLARELPIAENLRMFIASAIQLQYLGHGIVPEILAADYLSTEPTIADIESGLGHDPTNALWRILPENGMPRGRE